MPERNSFAIENNVFAELQIKETILILCLSVLIPFIIHLLPDINNIPIGAILLALFFAPLIAIRSFKFHVGLTVALLSPLINFAVTENPKAILLPIITFQLVIYTIVLKIFGTNNSFKYINALISYVICILASFVLLISVPRIISGINPSLFLLTSLLNALPGIILLVFVDYILRKIIKN